MDFAPLGDFNIMPDTEIAENAKWEVDAASLHAMIDPSLEGRPSGAVTIRRGQNLNENGKSVSKLDIVTGDIMLDSSDANTGRMARFAPAGTMEYNITDGYVRAAILSGQLHVEQFSKDHLLFETRFKTTPSITMTYSCNMVP